MNAYDLYSSPVGFNFAGMSRAIAGRYMEAFVQRMPTRMNRLEELVRARTAFTCTYSMSSVEAISVWFASEIGVRPRTPAEIDAICAGAEWMRDDPGVMHELDERTLSLCADIGYYVCETVRRTSLRLRWGVVYDNPKHVHYHRTCIIGFRHGITVDPLSMTSTFAYGAWQNAVPPHHLARVASTMASQVD